MAQSPTGHSPRPLVPDLACIGLPTLPYALNRHQTQDTYVWQTLGSPAGNPNGATDLLNYTVVPGHSRTAPHDYDSASPTAQRPNVQLPLCR
jgi:hypothetical protein